MVNFWDKVIYAIFSAPLAIFMGLTVCWFLSFYFQDIKGFSVYLLSVCIAITFTTLVSFVFPTFVSKILTALV